MRNGGDIASAVKERSSGVLPRTPFILQKMKSKMAIALKKDGNLSQISGAIIDSGIIFIQILRITVKMIWLFGME
jgi:hypothetical protein